MTTRAGQAPATRQDPARLGLAWTDVARCVAHTLAGGRQFAAGGRRYRFVGLGDPFRLQEAVTAVLADLRSAGPGPAAALAAMDDAVDRFLAGELGRARAALGIFRKPAG